MTKEYLLKQLALKSHRASVSSSVGEEPGMRYWNGFYDAVEAVYKLVEELDDGRRTGSEQEAPEAHS